MPTGLCQSEAIPRAGSPVDPNYIGGQFSSVQFTRSAVSDSF